MSTLQEIEAAIESLPKDQYDQLKHWFILHDPNAFDRQIEADAKAGKLDHLAAQALAEYERGETKPL